MLEALAAGTATSAQVVEVRPHLRHCTACRATVRELHMSFLRRVKLLLPLPWLRRRDDGDELAEALLADGGEWIAPRSGGLRETLASWLHRFNPSDVAAGLHIASASGGGRVATLGAIVGFCLSGLGAGTVCVVTGLVPNPLPGGGGESAERRRPESGPERRPARRPVVVVTSLRVAETATPTPAPPPPPSAPRRRETRRDPSQGRGPTAHRQAPVTPVATGTGPEFSFEQPGPATEAQAASAPATGGEEFTP